MYVLYCINCVMCIHRNAIMSLGDQLEKVFCFSQGHHTCNKQLVFGTLLAFLNRIASIRPVLDGNAFQLRMMTPCFRTLNLFGHPPAYFFATLCLSSTGVLNSMNRRF